MPCWLFSDVAGRAPEVFDASAPASWRPRVGRVVGRLLVAVLYRHRVVGAHRVPAAGGAILAANHTGYLDGAVVFAAAPRPSHFLVLDLTFTGWVGRLLRLVGQIPLDQTCGDRQALGGALRVLGRGGLIGIFPEGARGRGDLAQIKPGVAWLALQGDVPVIPVACLGTRATGGLAASWPRLRSRVVVDFGTPIRLDPPPELGSRERVAHGARVVQDAVRAHVQQAVARHGVPLPQDVPTDLVS